MQNHDTRHARLGRRQIDQFRRDGFVTARSFYDEHEMQAIVEWIDAVVAWPEAPDRQMVYLQDGVEPGRRVVQRIENFVPFHPQLAGLLVGGRLELTVGQLLGEPAVLFKEKVMFKEPGTGFYGPHQDSQYGWDRYASRHVTAMISIDEANLENGCLELAAGWHQGRIGAEWSRLTEQEAAPMEFLPQITQPGDVVFFDGYAPHQSRVNQSDGPRRVIYATYNRASEGDHRARYFASKRQLYPPHAERDPHQRYTFRA